MALLLGMRTMLRPAVASVVAVGLGGARKVEAVGYLLQPLADHGQVIDQLPGRGVELSDVLVEVEDIAPLLEPLHIGGEMADRLG